MTYSLKEIFFTLQGEGAQTGRPAVFCRFTGCNLWSGLEEDRSTAVCQFCDTDFAGTDGPRGGQFETVEELAAAADSQWPDSAIPSGNRLVVCTGGEPLLQLDEPLIEEFHRRGFEVAVETNGTISPFLGIDWICMSPKAGTEIVVKSGNELKLIFPQQGADPEQFESFDFDHFFLQPMDGPQRERYTQLAQSYCRKHSRWQVSLQTHKLLGLP